MCHAWHDRLGHVRCFPLGVTSPDASTFTHSQPGWPLFSEQHRSHSPHGDGFHFKAPDRGLECNGWLVRIRFRFSSPRISVAGCHLLDRQRECRHCAILSIRSSVPWRHIEHSALAICGVVLFHEAESTQPIRSSRVQIATAIVALHLSKFSQ